MPRELIFAAFIIVGAALVFSTLLDRGAGPTATLRLNAQQTAWLADRPGLSMKLEETGSREVSGARHACYAVRTMNLTPSGTVTVRQVCTDEQNNRHEHETKGSWRLDGERLCIDARPLDRDPECWRLTFRDGTLEFENEAHAIRWRSVTVAAAGIESSEDLLRGLRANE